MQPSCSAEREKWWTMGPMGPWIYTPNDQHGTWKWWFGSGKGCILRFHVNLPGCMGVSGVSHKNTVLAGRNPVNSQVEVGSLSHYLHGFGIHPTGGCERDFWTINSSSEFVWVGHIMTAVYFVVAAFLCFFLPCEERPGFLLGNVEVAAPSQRGFAIFGMMTKYPYCTHMNPFAIMVFWCLVHLLLCWVVRIMPPFSVSVCQHEVYWI